jgi:hypothetical protein
MPETCKWEEDEGGAWAAACDGRWKRLFEFTTGGPSANHFIFCPYCGLKLVEVAYTKPEDDDEDE